MATQLADYLFYIVALAILVSQAFILRATAQGMKHGGARAAARPVPRRAALEWLYAIVPAIALVALLWFSWKTMHPDMIELRGVVPPARTS
jgi:heme/copper-type cytochrome/quinol oxidase subunit 2